MPTRIYHAYAGPSTWSAWTQIASQFGVTAYDITANAVGSTIIKCRVRYFDRTNTQVISEFLDNITILTAPTGAVEVSFMGVPTGTAVDGTINP
ncbi:hypothetical protein ACFS5N_04570 [Mucilaginibacter ximonensis]|uniref:Uncharacterized protein n=1 Tax=Mucilaginibacter ximonensis TaxID=538021 RepID=A0ABW5Y9Q5_9SPHI